MKLGLYRILNEYFCISQQTSYIFCNCSLHIPNTFYPVFASLCTWCSQNRHQATYQHGSGSYWCQVQLQGVL